MIELGRIPMGDERIAGGSLKAQREFVRCGKNVFRNVEKKPMPKDRGDNHGGIRCVYLLSFSLQ